MNVCECAGQGGAERSGRGGEWHEVNRDFRTGVWRSDRKCSVMFVAGATPVSILIRSTYNRLTLRRDGEG